MRLVLWHYDLFPTAPGVYLKVFPRRGHRVVWVEGIEGEQRAVRRWEENGVEHWQLVRRRDVGGWRPLAVVRNRLFKLVGFPQKVRVLWHLASTRPDALQVRTLLMEGLIGWLAARRFGVPFFFFFDYPSHESRLHVWDRTGQSAPAGRLIAHWWMGWRAFLFRRADLVLTVSDAMGGHLGRSLGIPASKLATFPVGIDRRLWEEIGSAPDAAVPGLDPDRPVVAYMGNLDPIREPEFLLDVVERILARVETAQFLLIAEVPPGIAKALDAWPPGDRVFRTGFRPRREVMSLLRLADVALFPLPTRDPYGVFHTSSPLKVVEYLSAGVPVVSSRIPDAESLLRESGGGVAVENDVDAFSEAAIRLLEDPERARAMGQQGREFVGRHRTFDVLAERVEVAYRRVLTGERGPEPSPGENEGARWAS